MFNIYNKDSNQIKQEYRKMTMSLQNNPNELDKLNNEYKTFLDNIINNTNSNTNSNLSNMFQSQLNDFNGQPLLEPKIMFMSMDPNDEKELMNNMMNCMPDLLNVAFDMKKKYNKKYKNKDNNDMFASFLNYLNINNDDEDVINNLQANEIVEIKDETEKKEDINVDCEISLYDIYDCKNIVIKYKSFIYHNGEIIETVNNKKEITLNETFNHNMSKKYPYDGNKYIFDKNNSEYSNLIVNYKIKEHYDNNSNIMYRKQNNNYIIEMNITFPESILGFSRNIKLPNKNETKLNINSNGKIIQSNFTKILKNKGFNNGDIVIKFNVSDYSIKNFKDNKEILEKIFI